MMKKHLLMRGLNFLCSRTSSLNNNKAYILSSFNLYTSKSDSSSENPNSHSENDVTSAELKTQIDKFYKGDFEAIPTIFESILKRKLAGKHQDSDDELMNEFREGQPDVDIDQVFDSSSSSDIDSDSD